MTENELYEFCIEHFEYNEESGILTLRKHRGRGERLKVGDAVGTIEKKDGYLVVKVRCKGHKVHRLIWLMKTGKLPEHQIDHIDGNILNNAWVNLRDVPVKINQMNKRTRYRGSSHAGVRQDLRSGPNGKWSARIWHNNKNVNLGTFDTEEEAVKMRKEVQAYLGYHKNHGKLLNN
jgi:hypothetical protein